MDTKSFSDAGILTYLALCGFKPTGRFTLHGRTNLSFDNSNSLKEAVEEYYGDTDRTEKKEAMRNDNRRRRQGKE